MNRAIIAIAGAFALVTLAGKADAQNLGPYRQFLAIEPYYAHTRLDAGDGVDKVSLNGYGARLWINLAPFAGPHRNLISKGAIALFMTRSPANSDGVSVVHYGVQHDAFFVNRPLGGLIDPFVSVGAGAFRTKAQSVSRTHFALSPGGGIRIPFPNRFELRGDARDAIVFGTNTGPNGSKRTTHNLELMAALGITF